MYYKKFEFPAAATKPLSFVDVTLRLLFIYIFVSVTGLCADISPIIYHRYMLNSSLRTVQARRRYTIHTTQLTEQLPLPLISDIYFCFVCYQSAHSKIFH